MRLSSSIINDLAEMICGGSGSGDDYRWANFPYRSSSYLTRFFRNCELDYTHDGTTRAFWVEKVLEELNQDVASIPQLPSDSIIRVIQELIAPFYFERLNFDRNKALEDLNKVLLREGFEAYLDNSGKCYIRNNDKTITSAISKIQLRPPSAAELLKRKDLEKFLDTASEDDLIEKYLVPLFRQLGFSRVIPTGHRDKSLEFGKDIWMKYRLPTGHFIYFSAQVKKDKIDAAGKNVNSNISSILAQARMALDYPIFDPETNRKYLLDHLFIISAGVITKQAKEWLSQQLDKEARRHIIFMDKDELLDLGAMTAIEVNADEEITDDIPF